MKLRGRRWSPDKQGLVKAAVGLVTAATNTALPLGAAADAIFAVARLGESDVKAWQDRLIKGIEQWARERPDIVSQFGELPTGWDERLIEQLGKLDAATLLGSDKRTREAVQEALARSVFTPLTSSGWEASRVAAGKLLDELPRLVVDAAGPDPGLKALREVLEGDLAEVLDRLPPEPADRTALEAYLTALRDVLDHDPWTRIAGGSASTLTLIARRLSVHARADTGYGVKDKDKDAKEVEDAGHLVDRCERLVILGGPGAGKTWLARRSAINAAEAGLEAFASQADVASVELPLFARCAAVFGSDADAWEAVITAALAQVAHRLGTGRVSEAIKRRFLERPGRYLVVLDGLDEAEHLPAADLLDRLAATAGRELRIVLTTRPSSWRRQLPLDEQNKRHRVAELQPLRYPEDVVAVVGAWLTDRPKASDRLLTLLQQRAGLAEMATTPLLCAMYCLLAGTGDPLPPTRRELHERIVTRLLQGTWHLQQQQPTGEEQAKARAALAKLAWAGALKDPATGLGAWPEDVRPAVDMAVPEPALAAISHIAPAVEYDPDVAVPARRFIHRSIREHLVAEHLATLSADDAKELIEPHLWYDPDWEQVLPAAITGHPQRDALLRALLVGDEPGSATWLAVNRRDGFGELRRLLAQLATESSPGDWSKDNAALINDVCGGLTAAAMGWSRARPTPSHLVRLQAGDVPWPERELRDWIGYLKFTPDATKAELVQCLVDLLTQKKQPKANYSGWEVGVAIALDTLGPSEQQRAAAIDGLASRLRKLATLEEGKAFRVLNSGPAPDGLVQAVHSQLASVDDMFDPDQRAADLVETLDVLGAEVAVRHQAVGLLVDRLATLPSRPKRLLSPEAERTLLLEAIARGGPNAEQRARTIHLLLRQLRGLDSWNTRQLMQRIGSLLPTGPDAGVVLRQLMETEGPWDRSQEAGEVVGRLAEAASEEDRRAAAAAVGRRIDNAAARIDAAGWNGWDLRHWVEHMVALQPTIQERTAVVEQLLGRLPDTPIGRIGFITSSIRMLEANQEQRERLVRHLVEELKTVEEASWLCEMISWFSPKNEARSATVAALIESVASLDVRLSNSLTSAAAALQLTDDERQRLIDRLLEKLGTLEPFSTFLLTPVLVEVGPSPEQRATAVNLLLTQLEHASPNDLDLLVGALYEVDVAEHWRGSASQILVLALVGASPNELPYRSWLERLPDLVTSTNDRRRLVAAFIGHLLPGTVYDVLPLLESLEPTDAEQAAITERLVTMLASARDSEAAGIAEVLARRKLPAGQRRAAVQHLLERLHTADHAYQLGLLRAVASLQPEDDQRRAAVMAAYRHMEESGSSADSVVDVLTELGGLTEEGRRRALDLTLDQLVANRNWQVTQPQRATLLRLGLDALALREFAGRLGSYSYATSILHDLADTLRSSMNTTGWRSALPSWAKVHSALYGPSP